MGRKRTDDAQQSADTPPRGKKACPKCGKKWIASAARKHTCGWVKADPTIPAELHKDAENFVASIRRAGAAVKEVCDWLRWKLQDDKAIRGFRKAIEGKSPQQVQEYIAFLQGLAKQAQQ